MNDDKERGTGRTTRAILDGVQAALYFRGQWIEPRDHYDSLASHKNVVDQIAAVFGLLGVEYERTSLALRVIPR